MKTKAPRTLSYKLRKKNADTLTPITIFKRLDGERKFLLESSFEHEKKGKYSYIGSDPYLEVIGHGDITTVIHHETGEEKKYKKDPLQYLKENLPKIDIDLPLPFTGGGIGYVGYDAIRQYEDIGPHLPDELNMPDVHFMIYKNLLIYKHSNESVSLVTINVDDEQESVLDQRLDLLETALKNDMDTTETEMTNVDFQSDMSEESFKEKVKAAKQYIDNGEASQIVISKRMKTKIDGDPFSYYRKLRIANPSPYMFYIDFGPYLIVGASPESLIQTTKDYIVTNPIAGTRARGKTDEEDTQLMEELLADKKEISEHRMLVDLSENDLAKVCDSDSITIPTYMKVEKYQHVMHIVSEVHGKLKQNLTSIDALIACMPAGTVSGSPKKRAMQIINELENTKRGFYGGGIGYIGFNHDLNMALAIRSIVIKDHHAYLQTGAGIVQDSNLDSEFAETLHKARSLMEVNQID